VWRPIFRAGLRFSEPRMVLCNSCSRSLVRLEHAASSPRAELMLPTPVNELCTHVGQLPRENVSVSVPGSYRPRHRPVLLRPLSGHSRHRATLTPPKVTSRPCGYRRLWRSALNGPFLARLVGHPSRFLPATNWAAPTRAWAWLMKLIETIHGRSARRAARRGSTPSRGVDEDGSSG